MMFIHVSISILNGLLWAGIIGGIFKLFAIKGWPSMLTMIFFVVMLLTFLLLKVSLKITDADEHTGIVHLTIEFWDYEE